MNILYCGDANIEAGMFLSILSILNHVKEELHIYVLTMEWEEGEKKYKAVSESYIDFLEKYMKEQNENHTVQKVDIQSEFKKCVPQLNMDTRFTPFCMLRLFADCVPDIPNRILYLDNDVLCCKDLTEFYYQDIENHEFAGVLDYYGSWFFRNRIWKRDYVNSGVLLLNMQEIRKTGLFERSRILCRNQKMFMPDQSALNKSAEKKKILPRKFNEQRKLRHDTVLQHFTTTFRIFPWIHTVTVKPWEISKVHNKLGLFQYDELYKQYATAQKSMIEGESRHVSKRSDTNLFYSR